MFASHRPDFTPAQFLDANETKLGANGLATAPAPVPVAFDGCLGFYHPAGGHRGIVVCGAWGYEELILRPSWRRLADMLAAAGFPCLRFDYPATGDSLGDAATVGFEDWAAATERACAVLRATGVTEIVLIGQSFGALVACAAAPRVAAVGLVLLAPATGRRFLRKTAHWAAMVASTDDAAEPASEALRIAGFSLPPRVRASLQAMGGNPFEARPADWALLVEPPDGEDAAFGGALSNAGVAVERLPFAGLDDLLSGPTTAKTPWPTYEAIVRSLVARAAPAKRGKPRSIDLPAVGLDGHGFHEEPMRFGRDGGLFGILCRPAGAGCDQGVVFTNTGRNAHTGWRRMTVDHARALAAAGIVSLRFDATGVGDSADDPHQPPPALYSEVAVADAIAAVDVLVSRGVRDIGMVGVCSGAYLTLLTAVADPRIGGLVAVNLPRFAWDPGESIEAAVKFANRPADHTLKRLLSLGTLRLIATGRLDPRPAIGFWVRTRLRAAALRLAPWVGRLSPGAAVYRQAHARLDSLLARNTDVFLGYSATDMGLTELKLMFGKPARLAARYPTLHVETVDGADHNLTQDHACDWLLAQTKNLLARRSRRSS